MDEKEYHRAQSRAWRARNREKHRADVAAWRVANPEKARAIYERRLARKREAAALRRKARDEEREATREAREEVRRAKARAKYAATKDRDREKRAAQGRAFREANPGYFRAWKAAHPGRLLSLTRAWKKANPEKVREKRKGRSRKSTARRRAALLKLQKGRCAYCREKLVEGEIHVDHIVPRALGGSNKRSNLQLACATCNISKGARPPEQFARSIGMLI